MSEVHQAPQPEQFKDPASWLLAIWGHRCPDSIGTLTEFAEAHTVEELRERVSEEAFEAAGRFPALQDVIFIGLQAIDWREFHRLLTDRPTH